MKILVKINNEVFVNRISTASQTCGRLLRCGSSVLINSLLLLLMNSLFAGYYQQREKQNGRSFPRRMSPPPLQGISRSYKISLYMHTVVFWCNFIIFKFRERLLHSG